MSQRYGTRRRRCRCCLPYAVVSTLRGLRGLRAPSRCRWRTCNARVRKYNKPRIIHSVANSNSQAHTHEHDCLAHVYVCARIINNNYYYIRATCEHARCLDPCTYHMCMFPSVHETPYICPRLKPSSRAPHVNMIAILQLALT